MPNSFSRFLTKAELLKVREVYLQSLKDAELRGSSGGTSSADAPEQEAAASAGVEASQPSSAD